MACSVSGKYHKTTRHHISQDDKGLYGSATGRLEMKRHPPLLPPYRETASGRALLDQINRPSAQTSCFPQWLHQMPPKGPQRPKPPPAAAHFATGIQRYVASETQWLCLVIIANSHWWACSPQICPIPSLEPRGLWLLHSYLLQQ